MSSSPVKSSLKETIAKARMAKQISSGDDKVIDPFENCCPEKQLIRKKTGLAFSANDHKCLWDTKHPENPGRFRAVVNRLKQLGLDKKCELFSPPVDLTTTEKLILQLHNLDHLNNLKDTCNLPVSKIEEVCTRFDSVYMNEETFDNALLAVQTVYDLALKVLNGELTNGMAVVRPPGHHAMPNEYNGYCFFNNVAVTAHNLISKKIVKKILIVDYDVHHGQGTQRMFYDRKDVLYFSIHRYEHGKFWPNLQESNSSFIGNGEGKGYNINIPLNETGCNDSDYLAIILQILLPVAYEFNPDLILISGGYDAAVGCPEGEMNISPAFYGHLITLLSGLANGKIVVALEGGYFPPSLAEGVAMTVKSLLGEPGSLLNLSNGHKDSTTESINSAKFYLRDYWQCFQVCESFRYPRDPDESGLEFVLELDDDEFLVRDLYAGEPMEPPYPTRGGFPEPRDESYFVNIVEWYKKQYHVPISTVTGYVCDDDILLHTIGNQVPENPNRIIRIKEELLNFGLLSRMVCFKPNTLDINSLKTLHDKDYIEEVLVKQIVPPTKDIYVVDETLKSVLSAVGGPLSLVDKVANNEIINGIAIVRPPGHHARYKQPSGFCFVNNVVAAAKHAIDEHDFKRVLIVDFDIHHGDGTQELTYNRDDIMFISVHRFDQSQYFPKDQKADFNYVGSGLGEGFNVNIPFNNSKMGNTEYLMVFTNIILPLAYSYKPDLVLVSAGFDAGINDPLGGGYQIHPEMFGHFIQLLKPIAGGKIILTLEGGYQLTTLAYSVAMCVKALLGDPLPMPPLTFPINQDAITTIRHVIKTQKRYWRILQTHKKIADLRSNAKTKQLIEDATSLLRNKSHQEEKREQFSKIIERINETKC